MFIFTIKILLSVVIKFYNKSAIRVHKKKTYEIGPLFLVRSLAVFNRSSRRFVKSKEMLNFTNKCVPLTISYHLYFLRISEVWSILHHGSVRQSQGKECYFILTHSFFWHFFVILHKMVL